MPLLGKKLTAKQLHKLFKDNYCCHFVFSRILTTLEGRSFFLGENPIKNVDVLCCLIFIMFKDMPFKCNVYDIAATAFECF